MGWFCFGFFFGGIIGMLVTALCGSAKSFDFEDENTYIDNDKDK